MASPVRKYSFINAKLRARISKILSEDFINRIVKTHSLHEALGLLRGTSFEILEEVYRKTGDLKLAELELFRQEIKLYMEIEQYVQKENLDLVQTLVTFYEVDNLKNALRLYFDRKVRKRDLGDAPHYVCRDRIHYDIPIDNIINAESIDDVLQALEDTPYATIFEKYESLIESEKSLFQLEVALDRFYYEELLNVAEKLKGLDRGITLRLIGVEIDLQNINWIIRFKSFYELPLEKVLSSIIPRGLKINTQVIKEVYSSQSISQFLQDVTKNTFPGLASMLSKPVTDSYSRLLLIERVLEQILLNEVRRILSGYPFNCGIILSYFILKKNEMRRIRTILNAKLYDIPDARIEDVI